MGFTSVIIDNLGDRMINEYREIGGMRIERGNRSTRIKPVPMLFVLHKTQMA
jgi:hypothetical protein